MWIGTTMVQAMAWNRATPFRIAWAPKSEPRDRRPYRRTADHIRGRVFWHSQGRYGPIWGMEVINTHTGKVLADDNCSDYTKMVDLADEVTALARAAWFWDFKRKDVQ